MKTNEFGGNWTKEKMEILIKYVPAYLTIMNSTIKKYNNNWKLLYYDGFAGSGFIENGKDIYLGTALEVLNITKPRAFDMYYFVEKNKSFYNSLHEQVEIFKKDNSFTNAFVVNDDFNNKTNDFTDFLKKNKNYKTLAFIDPFKMDVKWETIEQLKDLNIDLWMLLPTGALNRLLPRNGKIPDKWMTKLNNFLGITEQEIKEAFYFETTENTIFGEYTKTSKINNAIDKSFELYKNKLKTVFKYLSKPYELKNSNNSRMFHFFLASQNHTAINVANDIISKI